MTGNENRITHLRGDELPVTDEMRAQAFWLVRRYSSVAYIERMAKLIAAFDLGYEEYAKTDPPEGDSAPWFRETLMTLFTHEAALVRGLGLVRAGFTHGYAKILEGVEFGRYLGSRRFEDSPSPPLIGHRDSPEPSVGLYAWAERACSMSGKVRLTLEQAWAFPKFADPYFVSQRLPPTLEPLPPPQGVRVRFDKEVPVSGIWLPVDIPNGCPNYLWAGLPAPLALRLAVRTDTPPLLAGKFTPAKPAQTDYDYAPEPTAWELLWEDHRYGPGKEPDESAYLDETTAFPPYPPHHQPG